MYPLLHVSLSNSIPRKHPPNPFISAASFVPGTTYTINRCLLHRSIEAICYHCIPPVSSAHNKETMFIFKPSETCYHSTLDLFEIHNLEQAPLGHWDGKNVVEVTRARSKPKPPRGRASSVFASTFTTQPIKDRESRKLENDIKRMDIEWCASYGEVAKGVRERLAMVGGILERAADIHNRMMEVVEGESEKEVELKLQLLESLFEGVEEIVSYP